MAYEYDPDFIPDSSEESESLEYDEDEACEACEACKACDTNEKEHDYGEEEDEDHDDEYKDDNADDYDEDEEDEYEEEEEEDSEDAICQHTQKPNIMLFINSSSRPYMPNRSSMYKRRRELSRTVSPEKHKKRKYDDVIKKYNKQELAHFNAANDNEKDALYQLEKTIESNALNANEPLRFKFLKLEVSNAVKTIIISKLDQLNKMMPCSGEYFKLSNWMHTLSMIPIGNYHTLPITNKNADIAHYLQDIKRTIDNNIFGHEETKDQIVRILAQWISNPKSNGYVIGIQGAAGVGKTKLIKEGICKAMKYPFSFISLGGISDASYLNGHHYTYEGATHGKIIECLIKAKVMNPVFLFDELDKVSNTPRGDEIINTLIHITDPVQNDKFTDKYFEEIDLDLSKSLIIFTYNDENMINPILKDRMITIKVNGYNAKQKLTICKDYILPELLPQYNLQPGDVTIDDTVLKNIIDLYNHEEGVRSLKRVINYILSCINMMRYIPTDNIDVSFPFHVQTEFYNKYCNKFETKRSDIVWSMYT
jgi:ATP-dependent Lon protease